MQNRTRVQLFPLLDKYRVVTSGNLFSSAKTFIELDVPGFTGILPLAEELVLYTVGESMSANFNWGIFYATGFDRTLEVVTGSPFAIGATITPANAGPLRHTALAANGNFQLASRLFLGFGNAAGSSLFESGVCSAVLAVKTWGA